MKFNEWLNYVKSVGGVDVDGAYSKQCLDLTNHYFKNVIGLTGNTGCSYARDLIHNQYVLDNCELIENTSDFVPQKGDVACWTGYTYGHVAVCLGEGDTNQFKVIDQNYDCKCSLLEGFRSYTNGGKLYFLRPKDQSNIVEETRKSNEEIADEIIRGSWGNGEARREALTKAGYNYDEVQAVVNAKLGNGRKSNEEIAKEVIRGDWGNGDARKQSLASAGYDYNTIQAIVNKMLS